MKWNKGWWNFMAKVSLKEIYECPVQSYVTRSWMPIAQTWGQEVQIRNRFLPPSFVPFLVIELIKKFKQCAYADGAALKLDQIFWLQGKQKVKHHYKAIRNFKTHHKIE